MSSFDLIWRLIVLLLAKDNKKFDDQKTEDQSQELIKEWFPSHFFFYFRNKKGMCP